MPLVVSIFLFGLKGRMGATNDTDHTNWKRVAEDTSFTQRVNDQNLATHLLSASICSFDEVFESASSSTCASIAVQLSFPSLQHFNKNCSPDNGIVAAVSNRQASLN